MHVNEINNRVAYSLRFVEHIDKVMPHASARTLSLLDDQSWRVLAAQAGEKAPSNASISAIIALVRGREMAVEAIRASLVKV